MEQYEVKREFTTIEEAFATLSETEQAHCLRVSEYADALFVQACASDIYPDNVKVQAMLDPDNRDLVKAASKYITVGKAYVPVLYHATQDDFTAEEIALYRKFPAEGVKLAETLLTPAFRKPEVRTIAAAVGAAQERWDGAGFPMGIAGEEIPFLARLIAIAAAIDEFAVQKVSEKPYEYAIENVKALSDIAFDPALVKVAVDNRGKIKKVFTKFINQSRAILTTECLIRRRQSRPYGLWYRPIAAAKIGKTIALEATPYFKEEKTWVTAEAVEHIIKKENIANELMIYFVTELCDTLRRCEACALPIQYIVLNPLPTFMNRRGLDKALQQVFTMAEADPACVCIAVSLEQYRAASKTMLENIKKLSAIGCGVMLSGVTVETLPAGEGEASLKAIGFTHLQFAGGLPKTFEDKDRNATLSAMAEDGMRLLVSDLNKKSQTYLMGRNGISGASGLLYGGFMDEDAMIESELNAKETKTARYTPLLEEAKAAAADQAEADRMAAEEAAALKAAEKAAKAAEKAAAKAERIARETAADEAAILAANPPEGYVPPAPEPTETEENDD